MRRLIYFVEKMSVDPAHIHQRHYTVNSEIFMRVLFSRNFAYAKFHENKTSRNGEISLSFTDVG